MENRFIEKITSTKNQWVKKVHQLRRAKVRRTEQSYVIEGWHLVKEAIEHHATLLTLFVTEEAQVSLESYHLDITPILVTEEVLRAMSETPAPQGIIAIVQMIQQPDISTIENPILLMDRVQDPGNVGTMIRTADAAGCKAVVLNEGSADIYNAKVLRSMQGSQYHIPIYYVNFEEWLPQKKKEGWHFYGTELNEKAIDYRCLSPQEPYGVIMGNEGQGVDVNLLRQTTQNVYLPMKGKAESLNVAVATGILLFRWL